MNTPNQAEEIVDAALDLFPAERAGFVDQACGENAGLRQLVEGLLLAHEKAPPLRSRPGAASGLSGRSGSVPLPEKPGDRIGPYKLLEQVGEGGCGIVYIAEQEAPVRRRVALKVIKLGMDTRQVVARFEAERQALALMDHPNIAKVLDAGATDQGRPFFVMELVKGIPITDYSNENGLEAEQRLQLFVQVCLGIQHAHQKGIIHRDIKPSNILVADHDGVPVPKIIDFGIAKATADQPLTDKTVYTAIEQFLGTPAYMSPEQARLSGLDIDTRSDIYSLGVLLYELLTGQVPFEPKKLAAAGLEEMSRIIREQEPVRPSTRISTLDIGEQTTVARHRKIEPPRLIQLLRGDLDWIVMKCLEKDRTRRYETANGLARDVSRFLNNEPVTARPPSKLYLLEKLVRRNKVTFAAGGAVMLALVIGLGLSTWLFLRERATHRVAAAEAAKNRQALLLLGQTLGGIDPAVARGMDTRLLTMILTNASERLRHELTNQPDGEADLRVVLGKTFYAIGQLSNSLAQTSDAVRLYKGYFGPFNEPLAGALANEAAILFDLGEISGAERIGKEALEMRIKVLGRENQKVATSFNNVGLALWRQGKLDEAEHMEREALRIRRKILPRDHPDLAQSLLNEGTLLMMRPDFEGAETMFRDALELEQRVAPKHPPVTYCLNNLATVNARRGDLDEAIALHKQALKMRRELYPKDHKDIAESLTQIGYLSTAAGDFDAAELKLRDALAMWNRLGLGDQQDIADTLLDWGILLMKTGQFESAETNVLRALTIRQKVLGPENSDVAEALDTLALLKVRSGDLDGAAKLLSDATRMNHQALGADHPDLIFPLIHFAWVEKQRNHLAQSEALHQEAFSIGTKRGLYGAQAVTGALLDLVDLLRYQGKFAQAEELLLEASQFCQPPAFANSGVYRNVLRHGVGFYETWEKAAPPGQPGKTTDWKLKLGQLVLQRANAPPNP